MARHVRPHGEGLQPGRGAVRGGEPGQTSGLYILLWLYHSASCTALLLMSDEFR
jgi:hypothetical protein